jgi:hypothetical protein
MSYAKDTDKGVIDFSFNADSIFDAVSMRTLYRARQIKLENGQDLTDDYAITEDERSLVHSYLQTASFEVLQEVLKITQGVENPIDISKVKYKGATKITYTGGTGTPFEYEEKVTGGTSEATGYVAEDTSERLILINVDGTFEVGETINGDSGASATTETASVLNTGEVIFAIKDKQAYNPSILDLVDQRIKEALTLFCMKDWYKHCGLGEDYKLALGDYQQEMIKLNNNLFQLKKPTIA